MTVRRAALTVRARGVEDSGEDCEDTCYKAWRP